MYGEVGENLAVQIHRERGTARARMRECEREREVRG
jgi:hypothetical protein